MKKTDIWDLKEIVGKIISKHPEVKSVHLFGSRGHNTGSRRSDIDLLIYSEDAIQTHSITDWVTSEYPPVDIFKTTDMKTAESIINASVVQSKTTPLNQHLDAILLWDEVNKLNSSFKDWLQYTDKNIDFKMTYTGIHLPVSPEKIMEDYYDLLSSRGLPTFFTGHDWGSLGFSIENIIKTAFNKPLRFSKKAKSFSFNTIKLNDEYDFQNFIHLLLRPIFPSIQPENKVCEIDGNEKIGDFGIYGNKVVIEAKHITTTSSKNAVLKTIEGLANFYTFNPNVKLLHFFVLYEKSVKLDETYLEGLYTKKVDTPPIFVTFIENTYI